MKKALVIFGLSVLVLLVVGVFVAAADLQIIDDESISISPKITDTVLNYVEEFVQKRDITSDSIKTVTEVDFDTLPKEVNIENVGDHNVGIYEIDYTESSTGEDKQIYMVTYSVNELREQGDLIIAHDKRQFLQFGFDGGMTGGFLKTSTGVQGSLEKGYVMVRSGSVTAVSTNLEVTSEGVGLIEIIIYKNGKRVEFGNSFNGDLGVRNDYDVQSNNVVIFEPGDVISAYADASEGLVWKDVITMIEITTTD